MKDVGQRGRVKVVAVEWWSGGGLHKGRLSAHLPRYAMTPALSMMSPVTLLYFS